MIICFTSASIITIFGITATIDCTAKDRISTMPPK
nr:MAG TPA: hypothetical protein [Caudoviricetes sp.]